MTEGYPRGIACKMCLDLINDDVVLVSALNELGIGIKRIAELGEMSEYMKRKILDDNFHGLIEVISKKLIKIRMIVPIHSEHWQHLKDLCDGIKYFIM